MTEKMHPLCFAAKHANWEKVYRSGSSSHKTRAIYQIHFYDTDLGTRTATHHYQEVKHVLESGELQGLNMAQIEFNKTSLSIAIRGRKNQGIVLHWLEEHKISPHFTHWELPESTQHSIPYSLLWDYEAVPKWHLDHALFEGHMRGGKKPVITATFSRCDPKEAFGAKTHIQKALEREMTDWSDVDFFTRTSPPTITIAGEANCKVFMNWVGNNNPALIEMFAEQGDRMFAEAPILARFAEEAFVEDTVFPPENAVNENVTGWKNKTQKTRRARQK